MLLKKRLGLSWLIGLVDSHIGHPASEVNDLDCAVLEALENESRFIADGCLLHDFLFFVF